MILGISPGPDFRPPSVLGELQVIFIILVIATLATVEEDASYTLTSWARTRDRNRQVGGAANSLHLEERGALAIDVVPSVSTLTQVLSLGTRERLLRAIVGNLWTRFGPGFQAVDEGDHVHLELDL